MKAKRQTELERFAAAVPSMHVIREFMAWCEGQKIELAEPTPSGRHLQPRTEGIEHMMARYFGIDLVRLENERRDLLKMHSANTTNNPSDSESVDRG